MNFELLGKTKIRDMSASEIRSVVDALQTDVFTKDAAKSQNALNTIQFVMEALELEQHLNEMGSDDGYEG
jgi:hypothetical protein